MSEVGAVYEMARRGQLVMVLGPALGGCCVSLVESIIAPYCTTAVAVKRSSASPNCDVCVEARAELPPWHVMDDLEMARDNRFLASFYGFFNPLEFCTHLATDTSPEVLGLLQRMNDIWSDMPRMKDIWRDMRRMKDIGRDETVNTRVRYFLDSFPPLSDSAPECARSRYLLLTDEQLRSYKRDRHINDTAHFIITHDDAPLPCSSTKRTKTSSI
jgi:hypothetical protein